MRAITKEKARDPISPPMPSCRHALVVQSFNRQARGAPHTAAVDLGQVCLPPSRYHGTLARCGVCRSLDDGMTPSNFEPPCARWTS